MTEISIIIPALNERRALPATLYSIAGQSQAHEVIVVDGGSTDGTPGLAAGFPGVRVVYAPRGRATQMNHGAQYASGDVLLFLHADTLLPVGAVAELKRRHTDGRLSFGGFRQRFSAESRGLGLISAIHNWRCTRTGVVYGDQAMFVRRDLFVRAGGFPEVAELEDVMLSEALLESGAPSQLLPAVVTTDSRKFEQMGVVRAFMHCLLILACYEMKLPLRGRQFFNACR